MRTKIASSFALLLLPLAALGQNGNTTPSLNLFEATEQAQDQAAQPRQSRREQANHEPAFTLRGTGRFGDKYVASLLNRAGSPVRVQWREGEEARIEGHNGFRLVDVNSRSVSVRLSGDEVCIANETKGVACSSDGTIAILSLAAAAPLPAPQPEAPPAEVAAQAEGGVSPPAPTEGAPVPEGVVLNPFTGEPQIVPQISEEERRDREERARRRQEALRNFQPVRIPDDQVPPGMRKISTPFGDRLVPAEE